MIDGAKKIILIVEDEPALLNIYTQVLTMEGFHVLRAANGQEGMEIALSDKPNLILLDLLMPVMDGLTMMKKLREENVWGEKVPIIVFSNLSAKQEKITKAVIEYKPAGYLVKADCSLQDIIKKINEQLICKI